jgi:parallel beta-helix repeat protein
MRTVQAAVLLMLAPTLWASPGRAARPGVGPRPAGVAVKLDAMSPTGGIQEAIDTLGADGGVVTIPSGEYLLRHSICVRGHITLRGSGDKTVLRKVKQLGSKLAAKVDAEGRSVRVQSAAGFRAGDEIGIYDANTVGWLHAHAVVREVRGNELLLDRRVGRAFDPAGGAAVINYFPAITGRGMTRVVLKDLTIDGRSKDNPGLATVSSRAKGRPPDLGFTFAAINLMEMTEGRVEGCRVKGWPADGISLQIGSRNVVRHCVVENCRGPGFHAGGRETDSEFSDNVARGNLGDGFYFCAWVTRVAVKNNKFTGNKENGIGGLGDGGDTGNVVEGNLCRENDGNGISLWDGERNTVQNNTCANNSRSAPGRYSGISLAKTDNSVVSGNRCFDDQPVRTQKHGIEELTNCRGNTITGNDCRGNAGSGLALAGKDGKRDGNEQ